MRDETCDYSIETGIISRGPERITLAPTLVADSDSKIQKGGEVVGARGGGSRRSREFRAASTVYIHIVVAIIALDEFDVADVVVADVLASP